MTAGISRCLQGVVFIWKKFEEVWWIGFNAAHVSTTQKTNTEETDNTFLFYTFTQMHSYTVAMSCTSRSTRALQASGAHWPKCWQNLCTLFLRWSQHQNTLHRDVSQLQMLPQHYFTVKHQRRRREGDVTEGRSGSCSCAEAFFTTSHIHAQRSFVDVLKKLSA